MKKMVLAGFILSHLCALVYAQGDQSVVVGWRENAGADVAAGDVASQTGFVDIDARGNYIKTGEGTLEMPIGVVASNVPSKVLVLAGKLKLTTDASPTRDTLNPPAVIQDEAAFWVDATAGNGLQVSNGEENVETGLTPSYATKWLDRRETNSDSPTRYYALAAWTNNTESALWGVPPAIETINGRRAVYFGGGGSSQFMSFRLNGAYKKLSNIYEYFLVIGVTNYLGVVLGNYGNSNSEAAFFRVSTQLDKPYIQPSSTSGNTGYGARHYLDGRIFNPFANTPSTGFQLFNMHAGQILSASCADAFFNGNKNSLTGGDYLCEAIIFTNALSEVSRVAVERYLMAKWNLPDTLPATESFLAQNTLYAVASNATVEVAVKSGERTPALRIAGEGTVTKTGEGTLVLGPSGEVPFSGTFNLQAGDILSQGGATPALSVAAGTRLECNEINLNGLPVSHTAEYDAGAGTRVALQADAAAGVVEKDGVGPARIRCLQSGVKKLHVKEGQLILEGGVIENTLAADGAISAFITNHNFEIPVTLRTDNDNYRNHGYITADTGWTSVNANSMILSSVQNSSGGSKWSTWCSQPCPEGTNVLYLIGKGSGAYTTVTFPKSGRYQFSALASARDRSSKSTSYYNVCDVFLGATYAARKSFGTILATHAPFRRYYCRTPYVEAGVPYVVGVQTRYSVDSGLALDDFRLDYIPEADCDPAAYTIANGNFDDLNAVANPLAPDAGNKTANWVLTTDTFNDWQIAQIVNPSTLMKEGRTFTLASEVWNTAQLMLYKDGWAETSFTPPAGTYRLRGRIARWRGNWNGTDTAALASIKATIVTGSITNDLGVAIPSTEQLSEKRWPTSFTVDGKAAVTLRLTAASGVALVDDLDLVGADSGDDELLTDTACETSAWVTLNPAAPKLGNNAKQDGLVRVYDGVTSGGVPFGFYWGYNRFSGNYYLYLGENGGCQQTVTIPKAGTYRLVYHERSRLDANNGANPVMAWIRNQAGTYTNFISRSTHHWSTNFVEYVYHFQLPAAGTYVLAFQGTGWNWENLASENLQSLVDGVSLKYEQGTLQDTPSVPQDLEIEVSNDAILNLDFPGTVKLRRLRLGGELVGGIVDAATYPRYITGMGSLEAPRLGTVIFIR